MTPRVVRPGMDRRRAWAVLKPKLWVIPAAAVLGAVLGILLYLALDVINAPAPTYTLTRELYIDFAFNEKTKEAYDYYNAFTWNDIVHTDAILGKAAEKLPYEKERVSADTVIEMPSDIRLIHLIVEDTDREAVSAIADAVSEAIEAFGADMQEFERIYVIHPGEVKPVLRVKKTARAAEAGAILGLIFGIVGLGLWYSLDDRILVPGDLAGCVNCPVVMEKGGAVSYVNYLQVPVGTTIAALQLMLEEAAAAGKQYEGILLTGVDPGMLSRYDPSL